MTLVDLERRWRSEEEEEGCSRRLKSHPREPERPRPAGPPAREGPGSFDARVLADLSLLEPADCLLLGAHPCPRSVTNYNGFHLSTPSHPRGAHSLLPRPGIQLSNGRDSRRPALKESTP